MQVDDHSSIEALNLSRRTYHALARSGILTIDDLRKFYSNKNQEQVWMIGKRSLLHLITPETIS